MGESGSEVFVKSIYENTKRKEGEMKMKCFLCRKECNKLREIQITDWNYKNKSVRVNICLLCYTKIFEIDEL